MIDVSEYQGQVDWRTAHEKGGVDRAYIKFGERTRIDPWAARHIIGARAAGVQIGLYYYGHPSLSARQEAAWFLRYAGHYLQSGDLPPALDLEIAEGHDWPYLNAWKATFLQALDHAVGVRSVFYSYFAFWKRMELYADRPVWGADLNPGFTAPPTWAFHQYSFTGTVPGVSGHVDLDQVLRVPKLIP